MAWQAELGATLLVPSGNKKHLFVVVFGPADCAAFGYGGAPQLGLVCITTIYPNVPFDETCIVSAGEHDFVKHESYVGYRHFRLEAVEHAHACIAGHVWNEHIPCSADLLARIGSGVCASKFVRGEFRRVYGC